LERNIIFIGQRGHYIFIVYAMAALSLWTTQALHPRDLSSTFFVFGGSSCSATVFLFVKLNNSTTSVLLLPYLIRVPDAPGGENLDLAPRHDERR